MKFTKQITSLTLITLLTLLLFTLTACGGNKTGDNTDDNAVSVPQSVSQTSGENEQGSGVNVADTVVVPDVVGMNVDEATKVLEDLGLVVEIEVKHLTYKDINNTSLGYYDDGCVIEQDSKSGTVMVNGSTILLTYNINKSIFQYIKNDDNTITLTYPERLKKETDKSIIIPKEYDGYLVSKIDATVLEMLLPYATTSNYRIFVPRDVFIDNPTNTPIELY